jgi:hypothetical protein
MKQLATLSFILLISGMLNAGCVSSSTTDETSITTPSTTSSTSYSNTVPDNTEALTATASSGSSDVHYYNPNTGTQSDYDLDVDYDSNGDVERINFPNGGWIDDSHIQDQTHNSDGTITVTTDRGYEYTVNEPDTEDTNTPDSDTSDESSEESEE